jgi:hypothetical protein
MFEGLGRKKKRFHVQLPVKVSLLSESQPYSRLMNRMDRTESTITQNISANGCYIRLSKGMPVGSIVELEIALPALDNISIPGKINCHAVVVRVHPEKMSGKFGVGCRIQHFRFHNQSPRTSTAKTLTTSIARALRTVVTTPPEFAQSSPATFPQHAG